jgi:hypothetical protein
MTDLCREYGVSRKTGHELWSRYKEPPNSGPQRPLPQPLASLAFLGRPWRSLARTMPLQFRSDFGDGATEPAEGRVARLLFVPDLADAAFW